MVSFEGAEQAALARKQAEKKKTASYLQTKYAPGWIDKINAHGLVTIKFNEDMHIPSNLSHLNATSVTTFIHVSKERIIADNFNISKLNFTWHVKSFLKDTLIVQLNFSDPLYISPDMDLD